MQKIIKIDEKTRIKIIKDNFILEYLKQSRTKRIAWKRDGVFPNLTSLATHYIDDAPYRSIQGTTSMEKLILVVQRSTDQISRISINNQPNEKNMQTESEEVTQERIKRTLETQGQKNNPRDRENIALKDGQKFCPFQSTPEKLVLCDKRCMLYREDKPGYECYFMELRSISYFMSGRKKKSGKK